jgi:hypothetical protein
VVKKSPRQVNSSLAGTSANLLSGWLAEETSTRVSLAGSVFLDQKKKIPPDRLMETQGGAGRTQGW